MKKTKAFILILSAFCTISICHAQGKPEIILDTVHVKMSQVVKLSTPGIIFFDNQLHQAHQQELLPGQTMVIPYILEGPVPSILGVWLGSTVGSGAPLLIYSIAVISDKSGFTLYIHNPGSTPFHINVDDYILRFFVALSKPQ